MTDKRPRCKVCNETFLPYRGDKYLICYYDRQLHRKEEYEGKRPRTPTGRMNEHELSKL